MINLLIGMTFLASISALAGVEVVTTTKKGEALCPGSCFLEFKTMNKAKDIAKTTAEFYVKLACLENGGQVVSEPSEYDQSCKSIENSTGYATQHIMSCSSTQGIECDISKVNYDFGKNGRELLNNCVKTIGEPNINNNLVYNSCSKAVKKEISSKLISCVETGKKVHSVPQQSSSLTIVSGVTLSRVISLCASSVEENGVEEFTEALKENEQLRPERIFNALFGMN